MARRDGPVKAAVLTLCVLVGAAGLTLAPPDAHAQEQARPKKKSSGPLDAIVDEFTFTTDPGQPAEFVRKTRPPEEKLTYVPVGGPRAEPTGRPLDATQIHALESDLEATRARHDRVAHRRADRAAARSAAGTPYVRPVKKPPVKCLLTCTVTMKATRETQPTR